MNKPDDETLARLRLRIGPGMRFGKLVVVRQKGRTNRKLTWECLCSCGATATVISTRLRNGCTKSCGCLRSETTRREKTIHGQAGKGSHTVEYNTWSRMISRCENPSDKRFSRYGGRGITVDESWHNFPAFYRDMGRRPSGASLDRINNDGNYEPGNCRWATQSEQSNNTSLNVRVNVAGETKTITEWARTNGVRPGLYFRRIAIGWTPEKAVTTPKLFDRTLSKEPIL